MSSWFGLSLAALACWGVWGLFANLATRHLTPGSALVWEVVGAVIVAAVALPVVVRHGGLGLDPPGVAYAVLTGVFYTAGLAFVFLALAAGQTEGRAGAVHTILVLTALYPLVASLLNLVVLGEPLSVRQLVAIPFAVTAVALFATA